MNRQRQRPLVGAALLVCLTMPGASAQQQPALERGARIELVTDALPDRVASGWLWDLTPDSLTMNLDSVGLTAFALDEITQLRINKGRSKTAIVGAGLAGAALGALLVPALTTESPLCESGFSDVIDCEQEVSDFVIGAIAGGFGAALITRALLPDRWVHVQLDVLLRDGRFPPPPVLTLYYRF